MDSIAVASQQLFIDQSSCSPTEATLYTLLADNHTDDEKAVVNQRDSVSVDATNASLDTQLHILTRSQSAKSFSTPASDVDAEIAEAQKRASTSCPKGGKETIANDQWNSQLRAWKDEGDRVTKNWTELVTKAHNNGHWGKRRAYALLKQMYPNCNAPYKFVDDFASTCFICQMTRILNNRKSLDPMKLSTKEIYSKWHDNQAYRVPT